MSMSGPAALQLLAPEHAPVGNPAPPERLHARIEDVAELPAVRCLAQELRAGVVAILKADHQLSPRLPGRRHHSLARLGAVRQRLLAQHVAAGLQRIDGGLLVQLVRRANRHRVQLLRGQHLVPVRIPGRNAKALPVPGNGFLGDVGHRHHLHIVALGKLAQVRPRNATGADEAVAQLFVLRRASCHVVSPTRFPPPSTGAPTPARPRPP